MSCAGDKWEKSEVKSSPDHGQNKLQSKMHFARKLMHNDTHINQSAHMRFSRYVNANRLGNSQVFLAHDPDNLLNCVIFYA